MSLRVCVRVCESVRVCDTDRYGEAVSSCTCSVGVRVVCLRPARVAGDAARIYSETCFLHAFCVGMRRLHLCRKLEGTVLQLLSS